MSSTHSFMCYIEEGGTVHGTICSMYIEHAWYSDLGSRNITLDFHIGDNLSMRYLAFAISSNNYEWEVLYVHDKQNNVPASVTIPTTYDGTVKFGIKLYDSPPTVGSVLNVGFDYVITGGIDLSSSSNTKKISMTCETDGATIMYTLDGTDPTESSTEYIDEIEVEGAVTIKAKGFKEGMNPSEIATLIIEPVVPPNPTNWITIGDMKVNTTNITCICYGNGKFVIGTAYSTGIRGAYSTDGINWTAIDDMLDYFVEINSICYGNGKFVAVTDSNRGAYSTDGINWTTISDMKFGGDNVNSICYGNGKFVAVGNKGKGAYSTDGINWTAIDDMKINTSKALSSICYGNGKFIASTGSSVVQTLEVAYSTDGINWTAVSDIGFNLNFRSICYGNGKFVAVGGTSTSALVIAYSTDGINWTAIDDMGFTFAINFVCYGNDKFVAVGTGTVKGAYSEDGINWTKIDDMGFDTGSINGIAYGNDKFVAVGSGGKGSYCIY